jgi:hypothetical protein
MGDTLLEGRVKYRAAGDYAENVFHWTLNAGGVNDFDLAERLFGAMMSVAAPPTWCTTLLGMMSNEVFISTVSCRVLRPVGGNRYAQQLEANQRVGTGGDQLYTAECAYILNWMSLDEPSKLGRSYIPGIPYTFTEAGRYETAAVTAANAFANKHVAGITFGGSTFIPAIYRLSDHTWREIADGYLGPNIGQISRRQMGE